MSETWIKTSYKLPSTSGWYLAIKKPKIIHMQKNPENWLVKIWFDGRGNFWDSMAHYVEFRLTTNFTTSYTEEVLAWKDLSDLDNLIRRLSE